MKYYIKKSFNTVLFNFKSNQNITGFLSSHEYGVIEGYYQFALNTFVHLFKTDGLKKEFLQVTVFKYNLLLFK